MLRGNNYSITLQDPSGELPGTAQLFSPAIAALSRVTGFMYGDHRCAKSVTLVRLSEIITHEKLAASHFEIIQIEEDDY